MTLHFLDLPAEIRIQIYELLLADSSLTVQYLFIRNDFRSMFRNKTPPALSSQILRTCRQIEHEAAPVLYSAPRFDCSNCINGLEKLRAQIGFENFSLVKRLIVDSEDVPGIGYTFRRQFSGTMYRNLEDLTTEAHRVVDLSQRGWMFELMADEMSKLCLAARRILHSDSPLQVLGQISSRGNARSYGDAVDPSNDRVRWRFVRSLADLAVDEHPVDVERLLELSLLIKRHSVEAIFTMGDFVIPVPLLRGIQHIMYP
jgi:hypothetical protein